MDSADDHREWGNLRFRQRDRGRSTLSADDPARSRFVIGLAAFVIIALVYPWYSYRVQTYMAARDLAAMSEALDAEMKKLSEQAQTDAHAVRQEQARQAQAQRAAAARDRVARVKVMGATEGREGPIVVVNLGQAAVAESMLPICSQTSRFLGRPVAGESVRVQRYRGSQPALDAGRIRC